MSDEIDLEEAGAGVVPLGEGADGDLVTQPGADAGAAEPARRARGARGGEQAPQRRRAELADELVDLRRRRQLALAGQAIQQFRNERMETMRADISGGLPQGFDGRRHCRAIDPWPPGARARGRRPGRPSQQPNGRLAVEAGNGDDLIQERALLGAGGHQVPLPLHGRILPQARSRHGHQ